MKKFLNLFIVLLMFYLSSSIVYAIKDSKSPQNVANVSAEELKLDKKDYSRQTEYTNDIHSAFSLKDCIDVALKYNPQIQASIYNDEVYKTKIGQAWANYFPKISAGVDVARSRNSYSPRSYYLPNTSQTMSYIPNVSGEMLIFDFGKTKAAADSAKRTYESKQAETYENINTIIYSIKSTYFNILFAQAQVQVYEDTVKDFEMQATQAFSFYKLGKKARLDVVTAEYNLEKARLNLVRAKSVLKVAKVQLSKIMGIPEYNNYELTDQLLLNDYEQQIDDLIKTAYDVRPELVAAARTVDAAKLNLRAKRRDYAPDMSIFGSYGNGIGNDYNISSTQFGAGLSYNALNIAKTKKEVDEAKASYNKTKAEFDNVKDSVYLNVQKSYIDLQTSKEAVPIAKLSLDQAKEQYRQVTGRYKAGVGDAIELKDGENTYLNARLDFYNAVLNYNLNAASLEKEVGIPLEYSDKKIIEIQE